jgi:hypothetical protein
VLIAAWAAIPTVALYFSKLGSWSSIVATTLAWIIWMVFVAEAVIMIAVVADRWAWIRGHLFGLVIVLVTFPLLTKILEGLLAARALSTLKGVRILQVLYLAKAMKLIKSVFIVRKHGADRVHPAVWTVLSLIVAVLMVGIGNRIVTGEKHPTPLHGAWDALQELPAWSVVVAAVAAVVVAVIAVVARGRRDLRA